MNFKERFFTFIISVAICSSLLHFATEDAHAYQNYTQNIGEIIVSDSEVLIIDNTEYLQYGNVTVKENGNLTITHSSFCMAGENKTYITLLDNGTLKVVNSTVTSQVNGLIFDCRNNSRIIFEDTVFSFWGSTIVGLWGNSTAYIEDSRQEGWVSVETNDTTTAIVKNSTISEIECSGSSKILVQGANITKGSSCTQYSALIVKHSNFQLWLYAEDNSTLIATENSMIKTLVPCDYSNVTIDNANVKSIYLFDYPKILLTNGSNVENCEIKIPPGYSSISGIRKGYMKNCTLYLERTGLSINVYNSTVSSLDLNIGIDSNVFIEDCSISEVSVSTYGSIIIYNSEVESLGCDERSSVVIWNSKILLIGPIPPTTTIRYFSTIDLSLFYITVVIVIILTLALITIIGIVPFARKFRQKTQQPLKS